MAFGLKSLKPFTLFPFRSEAAPTFQPLASAFQGVQCAPDPNASARFTLTNPPQPRSCGHGCGSRAIFRACSPSTSEGVSESERVCEREREGGIGGWVTLIDTPTHACNFWLPHSRVCNTLQTQTNLHASPQPTPRNHAAAGTVADLARARPQPLRVWVRVSVCVCVEERE